MTTNPNLDQAREWAEGDFDQAYIHAGPRAAAQVIASLPDEWIDADKVRDLIEKWSTTTNQTMHRVDKTYEVAAADLETLLPAPQPRTLKDMTPEEREECVWMQARDDVGNRVVITKLNEVAQEVTVLYENGGHYEWPYSVIVPLPDLRRMVWPEEHYLTTDEDVSKSSPEIDMSRPHDGDVDMKPEDVPAGEVWVVSYGDGRAVGMREYSEYRPWHVMWDDQDLQIKGLWLGDKDITLVSRLLPEVKA